MAFEDLEFEWVNSEHVCDDLLFDCSELFSKHYGQWGPPHKHAGRRITLSPRRLREYIDGKDGWVALARKRGKLVGYALVVVFQIPDGGKVTWVTQLVVHRSYRKNDVASRLLRAVWGFSDHFAWGLVTANPFAVRALENATRRTCDPIQLEASAHAIHDAGQRTIPYVRDKVLTVDMTRSVLDTKFYIDHSDVSHMMESAQASKRWRLGPIEEGEEWFAFTLRNQPPNSITEQEFNATMAESDATLRRAYGAMALDEGHQWTQHTAHEVDHFLATCVPAQNARILDFGCGAGRHSIELAKRGYFVIGVDFVESLIESARRSAAAEGVEHNTVFIVDDCRTCKLGEKFDAALCLYDVIGSFPDDADNRKVLNNLRSHLRRGAPVLISAMNLELTKAIAKRILQVPTNPDILLELAPSPTMQDTGNIFNPDFFILDPKTHIVYRKEQFDREGNRLPCELIVRDRRYSRDELIQMCNSVGFLMLDTKYVAVGRWGKPSLAGTNIRAKEILYRGIAA
jgi:2-polyprenyl-3-methyl-5-hydroxy-6-metoxy-1,4-benzoquinol methylase/GNAT superfamily N-acetyltransferase